MMAAAAAAIPPPTFREDCCKIRQPITKKAASSSLLQSDFLFLFTSYHSRQTAYWRKPSVSLRQNGVGTGFTSADAILPKGHGYGKSDAHLPRFFRSPVCARPPFNQNLASDRKIRKVALRVLRLIV